MAHLISGIAGSISRILVLDWRWRHVISTTPYLHARITDRILYGNQYETDRETEAYSSFQTPKIKTRQ